MSRSYKRNPFHGIAVCKAALLKKAKQKISRRFRRAVKDADEEVSDGASYKKPDHFWKWRPDDGKTYDPDEKKSYRK